jgi:glycosyltransferase involved in cell wall biosynthesis
MKRLLSSIKHHKEIKLIKESELFDEHYYLTHYPEASKSDLSPLEHYVKQGSAAGLKPNRYFDDNFYRDTNPDVKSSGANPLAHFIKFGASEGRNPSRSFNTRFYLEQHPDVAVTGANPLWHFLKFGALENRQTDNARGEALSAEARSLYEELIQIEPLLPSFDSLAFLPLARGPAESLAGRAYFKLRGEISEPFSHLFVLRRLIHGGADRLAMHFVSLVREKLGAGSALVLLADFPTAPAAHLLADGVKLISLDELQPGLTEEDKIQVITRLILEAKPPVVHNINSDVGWKMYARYHQQLRANSALVASFFTCHFDEAGRRVGLVPQYFNSCIDHLDLVLTDNLAFKNDCAQLYALEQRNLDKIIVAYSPVPDQFRAPDPAAGACKRILWASRLHMDKRPDILAQIASRLPEVSFEVYGEPALEEAELKKLKHQPNINLNGTYSNFEDLPTAGINAFLYTTKHDGLPIALMEAIAAGLPTIAPDVGGTRELLSAESGWLIDRPDNVDAYVAAILECLGSPDERIRRALDAQKVLARQHSWLAFSKTIAALAVYQLGASTD